MFGNVPSFRLTEGAFSTEGERNPNVLFGGFASVFSLMGQVPDYYIGFLFSFFSTDKKAHRNDTFGVSRFILSLLFVSSCLPLSAQSQTRYTFSHPAMGTEFRLILYAKNVTEATQASQAACTKIDNLESLMSDYQPDSEVNRLSKKSGEKSYITISSDLWVVLKKAQEVSEITHGNFDITVGPLSRIWRKAFRRKEMPDSFSIENARKRVNYKWLKVHPRKPLAKLKKPKMKLDLGGIAKGFAVDQALKVLKEEGISSALVDGGGDIAVSNSPPGQHGWSISRKSVNGKGEQVDTTFRMVNWAIATSGDSYQYLESRGKRYSHIIDPQTGYGVTHDRRVTVTASTCMEADASASALSVMPEKIALNGHFFPVFDFIVKRNGRYHLLHPILKDVIQL